METRDTYQAGQSADESATPEKVIPLRQPWAQIEMDILTLGARCFSLAGTRCLLYLLRYTVGFHTMTVKLTVDEFCNGKRRKDGGRFDEGTDLSRPSVLSGLHELQRAHVIAIANEGHGRGTVATYELFPVECWQVERLSIGKKSLPINDEASIGKDSSPIAASNGKKSLPKRRIIGKKSLPHINIEVKDSSPKEIENDANASSDANAPTPHKRSSRPRKLTDEQYAAKMREEEWKAALFEGMEAINGYPITGKGKERAAAHELYGYRGPKNRDSVLSVETILDCYRLTLIDPFYGQDQLSLQTILKKIGAYLNSPENFRRGMEEKRRKAEYVSNGANGHKQPKQSRADAQAAAFTRSYEDVLPK